MRIRLFKNRLLDRPERSVLEIPLRSWQMYGGDSSEIHLSILRSVARSAFCLDANSYFSINNVQNASSSKIRLLSLGTVVSPKHLTPIDSTAPESKAIFEFSNADLKRMGNWVEGVPQSLDLSKLPSPKERELLIIKHRSLGPQPIWSPGKCMFLAYTEYRPSHAIRDWIEVPNGTPYSPESFAKIL
jgi:hypothetical protein